MIQEACAADAVALDLPADDCAALDIHDQVQVAEDPADGGGQIGDIPTPDLVVPVVSRGAVAHRLLIRSKRWPGP